jgi:hypothetical protein
MIDALAFAGLCMLDQQAVCKTLRLPLPTPDVSLDVILLQQKITPMDALSRLERAHDLRSKIAVACLKGVVKKCPASAQFNPKPYPKLAATPAKAQRPTREQNATRVLLSFIPNPKKPGSASYDRYMFYEVGLTEAQLLAKGLRRDDLRWDTARSHLTWAAQ